MSDQEYPEDIATIEATPLEAAKRQLQCAIEMWFAGGDAVSIHTLSAAAHQVIHDIHAKKCPDKELLFDATWVKTGKRKEFIDIVKEASNSFKHADWYPDKAVKIHDLSSLIFLMVALQGLFNLGESLPPAGQALRIWLALHRPDYIDPQLTEVMKKIAPPEQWAGLRLIKKRDFLQRFAEAGQRFPGGKWPG